MALVSTLGVDAGGGSGGHGAPGPCVRGQQRLVVRSQRARFDPINAGGGGVWVKLAAM